MSMKDILELIFSGLTAVGTIGATIVALYFAKKEGRERIKISAGIRIITPDFEKQYVYLKCTNIGRIKVKIIQFFWRAGITKKNYFVQIPPNPNPLPKMLDYAEEVFIFIPIEQPFQGELFKLKKAPCNFLNKYYFKLQMRFIKIGVQTSINDFYVSIDKSLKNKILEFNLTL